MRTVRLVHEADSLFFLLGVVCFTQTLTFISLCFAKLCCSASLCVLMDGVLHIRPFATFYHCTPGCPVMRLPGKRKLRPLQNW